MEADCSEELEVLRAEKSDFERLNTRLFGLLKDSAVQKHVGELIRNIADIHQARKDKLNFEK